MPEEASEQGTIRYVRCPSCATPNPASAAHCSRCGKPMPAQAAAPSTKPASAAPAGQITCPRCRKSLPAGSRFCGYCGAPMRPPAPAAQKPADQQMAPTQPMPAIKPARPAMKPPPTPTSLPQPPRPAVVRPTTPPAPPAPTPSAPPPAPPAPSAAPKAAPPPSPPPPPAAAPPAPPAPPVQAAPPPPAPAAPPPPVEAPSVGEGTAIFTGLHVPKLDASVIELKQDGSTGKVMRITKETLIGQGDCDLSYPADSLLSARHASVSIRDDKVILKDLGSRNGTFLKQRKDTELASGDVFLIGRQLFRFVTKAPAEAPSDLEGTRVLMGVPRIQAGPPAGKLERIQLTGEVVESFKIEKPETTLGRTKGDLTFKTDPYMSGEHARIVQQGETFILRDLKSRNGVYRRIRGEAELANGDEFFMGEQIFRAEVKVT